MAKINPVTKAITSIIIDNPFFGSLLLRLKVVENNDVNSLATDGTHIFYNPKYVSGVNLPVLKGIIVHELLHCVLLHHLRIKDRDAKVWNIACDYAVNYIVKQSGFQLPDDALDEYYYHDKTAEEIYDLLPKNGSELEKEIDRSGFGQVIEPQNSDETEFKKEEVKWKKYVSDAASAAKLAGKMPGFLDRFVDDYLDTALPWKEILSQFMHKIVKNDFSWTKPNKSMYYLYNIYFPSLYNHSLSDILIAVDTSGSIDHLQFNEFVSEINSILHFFPEVNLKVLYCDTRIHQIEEYTSSTFPPSLQIKGGGGGTSFVPVFDYANDLDETPAALLYFTDLEGYFPSKEPNFPVLWVKNEGNDAKPPFGEVLTMSRA